MKLKNGKSKRYIRLAKIIIITLAIFITSRFTFGNFPSVFADDSEASVSQIDQGEHEFKLINKEYYEDAKLLEIQFQVTDSSKIDSLNPIVCLAREKKNSMTNLSTQIYKVQDDFYVAFVKDVPNNWKDIYVALSPKDSTKGFFNNVSYTKLFKTDFNVNKFFERKSFTDYDNIRLNYMLKQAINRLSDNQNNIKKAEKEIDTLKYNVIENQKVMKSLDTASQETTQKKIDKDISSIKSKQKSVQRINDDMERDVESIERMQKALSDLNN